MSKTTKPNIRSLSPSVMLAPSRRVNISIPSSLKAMGHSLAKEEGKTFSRWVAQQIYDAAAARAARVSEVPNQN